jgi:hypothetical protein
VARRIGPHGEPLKKKIKEWGCEEVRVYGEVPRGDDLT